MDRKFWIRFIAWMIPITAFIWASVFVSKGWVAKGWEWCAWVIVVILGFACWDIRKQSSKE